MKKGLRTEGNDIKAIYIGRVYSDGSFGELIKLYNDENGIFQIEFLKGSDIAYSFLPNCTELLEILKDGIIGVSLEMIAEELLAKGYEKR